MTTSITLDEFVTRFTEEPGYLNFAWAGPIGRTVREEESAQSSLAGRARFGTMQSREEEERKRFAAATAGAIGFRPDQVVFQPNTSQGLMHAMFGLSGEVAVSAGDFPSLTFAAARASGALGRLTPRWLEPDHGRVTPGTLRDQLTDDITAVAVSLVDFRTGYVADLEGIRQVIGDRLLIVDAIQGFGVVEAPYALADVIVSGGQKWVRAGHGTGFLALSDRAVDAISPVFSGFSATDHPGTPVDEVLPPTRGAAAFQISYPDPIAQARLSAALEEIALVGVPVIAQRVAENVARVIELADEFGLAVVSPRDDRERAGIVVVEPQPEQLTVLAASLHNHGITSTTRDGTVRLSPHATTDEETFAMLRASLMSFGGSAI